MGDSKHCHSTSVTFKNFSGKQKKKKKEPGFDSNKLEQNAKVTSEVSTVFVVFFSKSFTFDSKAHLVM